jgi:monothiol glutaredoxin
MPLSDATRQRIRSLVESNRVVLFMKGTPDAPECGFSANIVGILDGLIPEYEAIDVLRDPEIREGIKEYGSWPTIPQLYVEGELLGGSDIVNELRASGELQRRLGVPVPEPRVPAFAVSNAAANEVHRLAARLDVPRGYELRLTIDARRRHSLGFSPASDDDVVVESSGIRLLMDRATASRADGLALDVVETPNGTEFRIGPPG